MSPAIFAFPISASIVGQLIQLNGEYEIGLPEYSLERSKKESMYNKAKNGTSRLSNLLMTSRSSSGEYSRLWPRVDVRTGGLKILSESYPSSESSERPPLDVQSSDGSSFWSRLVFNGGRSADRG